MEALKRKGNQALYFAWTQRDITRGELIRRWKYIKTTKVTNMKTEFLGKTWKNGEITLGRGFNSSFEEFCNTAFEKSEWRDEDISLLREMAYMFYIAGRTYEAENTGKK